MKTNPYVESIELKRIFPSEIVIVVKERKPTYFLKIDEGKYACINNQGYILELKSQTENLPEIISYSTENIESIKRLNNDDLIKLESVLKIMNVANINHIGNLITKIDIAKGDDIVLYLESENKTIYFGNESDINTKIFTIKEILEREKGVPGEIFMNGDTNKSGEFIFREKV